VKISGFIRTTQSIQVHSGFDSVKHYGSGQKNRLLKHAFGGLVVSGVSSSQAV
jgi:hypothetical protein